MTDYFPGRQNVGTFVLRLREDKVRIECTIWQTWDAICHTVLKCGRKDSFTVTRRVGVKQTERQSVEGAIEGAVGTAAIASLKSSVKGVLQQDITWESETSVSHNFEFQAPECGRITALIYQLIRNYDIRYQDLRFLHRDSWAGTVTEYTIHLFDASKTVLLDPDCHCPKPPPRSDYDGFLKMVIGSVMSLVPYRKTSQGFQMQIGGQTVAASGVNPEAGFGGKLETLPPLLRFLVGRDQDTFTAEFHPYREAAIKAAEVAVEAAGQLDRVSSPELYE